MTRVCFVSYEIHPTVMGGCGVLLYHAARVLLQQGHEVIFLLDLERKDFERFSQVDRLRLPQAHNCRAYQVDALLRPEEQLDQSFQTVFEVKSYRFYRAARRLCEIESPQVIEFFEYCGAAYHALSAKIAGLDFAGTRLVVRLHNTMELIDRQQPDNRHGMDRYIMYGLEHRALRLAESVLYPSQAFLSDTYRAYYGPWFGGLVLSPPALLEHPQAVGEAQEPDGILFYGRLFGFKGVDRFVDAAVLYLSDTANPRRTFYLAGYDSMLPPTGQGSYRDYLRRKIPAELRPSFVFTGQISWAELGELLPRILFAVIPSYLESFCYAAHELYAAGVPLVLTNLPAFQDSFHHGENALIFDGSVSDLAEKMRQLSSDASLRRRITRPYPVAQQQLAAFYPDPPKNSWINPTPDSPLPELLVCILVDQSHRLPQTLQALGPCLPAGARVVLMQPATAAQVRPISQAASQANRNHSPLAGAPVDSAA
ncbi:MAG: glycosyltransferase family 4 protein, partial [Chloroflexota bacterium]